jgi:hypothetical protein
MDEHLAPDRSDTGLFAAVPASGVIGDDRRPRPAMRHSMEQDLREPYELVRRAR